MPGSSAGHGNNVASPTSPRTGVKAVIPRENSPIVSIVQHSPEQLQHESLGACSSYSTMAARTVANIKRLQENVLSLNISSNPASTANSFCQSNVSTVTVVSDATLQQHHTQQDLKLRSVLSSATSSSNTPLQPPEEELRTNEVSGTVHQVLSPVQQTQNEVFQSKRSATSVLLNFSNRRPSPSSPASPQPPKTSSAAVTVDPNWQSSKMTVRERNSVMCNNELMADIHFLVGSELLASQLQQAEGSFTTTMPQKIPAHKYVLATGSTVFYAMLYGGLSGADASKDVIEVPDVEPAAFLTMLKYLYYDEINLTPDNVLATLYCAKKYILPHLADACVRFLETSLTARNACLLLSQSIVFGETALMERSWEVIDAQAELALTADGFTDIDYATLTSILGRETLNCKETVVFEAAQSWASAECKRRDLEDTAAHRREVLGPVLYDIRFPGMSVQDFADYVATSGILSLQETTDIFLHFTAKNKPLVKYVTKPRKGLKSQVCRRFQSSAYRSNQWRYRGRCDAIQFCVDKRIFIVGFGLYGSSNGSSDYTAKIELKTTCQGSVGGTPGGSSSVGLSRVLAENVRTFYSDGSSSTFHVFFDQPVQVEPDVWYTALAVLDGAELSYFGQEGMTEVTAGCVTFQFQGSSESTNGTGIQGGQIPELIFYGPQADSPPEMRVKRVHQESKDLPGSVLSAA